MKQEGYQLRFSGYSQPDARRLITVMAMRLSSALAAALVFVGVLGCDLLSGAEGEQASPVTVETDNQSYSESDTIDFAVRNAASDSLSLYFCNRLIFQTQKRQDGKWTPYSGTICKDIYPIEFKPAVAPGGVYEYVTGIQEEGTYRLQLEYKRGSEEEKVVHSNKFTVQ